MEVAVPLSQMMNFSGFQLFGFLVVTTACIPEKSLTDEVSDMLARCWEYVDTGNFPSRGLFWSSNDGLATYDNGNATVSALIDGVHLDHLKCSVMSKGPAWPDDERDTVFASVVAKAPNWVTSREGVANDEFIIVDLHGEDHFRHVVVQVPGIAGTFVEASQGRRGDVIRFTLGKSLLDETARLKDPQNSSNLNPPH